MFLAEARRLLDYQWRRGDAFERKALGVLAFTGVTVALLPTTITVILSLRGGFRAAALILGGLAVVCLASGAIAAAGVLWARDSKSVRIAGVQTLWSEYLARLQRGDGHSDRWHTADLQRNLVEMLLHGTSTETSPVQSLHRDADSRATWFTWAVRLILCAVIFMLAVTVCMTWGRL